MVVEIRRWTVEDRAALLAARDASAAELAAWMPGVTADLQDVAAFLRGAAAAWSAGTAYLHAIVVDGEIVGHCSLHVGEDGVGEIGYWVRTDRTGRGIATSAVHAIVAGAPGTIGRFEIHCDVANTSSARIAAKTGFVLDRTVDVPQRTPCQSGREQIWTRSSELHQGSIS